MSYQYHFVGGRMDGVRWPSRDRPTGTFLEVPCWDPPMSFVRYDQRAVPGVACSERYKLAWQGQVRSLGEWDTLCLFIWEPIAS